MTAGNGSLRKPPVIGTDMFIARDVRDFIANFVIPAKNWWPKTRLRTLPSKDVLWKSARTVSARNIANATPAMRLSRRVKSIQSVRSIIVRSVCGKPPPDGMKSDVGKLCIRLAPSCSVSGQAGKRTKLFALPRTPMTNRSSAKTVRKMKNRIVSIDFNFLRRDVSCRLSLSDARGRR